jgi:hypothetical protein
MVLDSAIDPSLTAVQYADQQAGSYEQELDAFFAWCTSTPSCAWHPGGDPTTALLALIQRSRTTPLQVDGGGTAGPGELYDALLAGLEAQSSWPTLASALAGSAAGNGTVVYGMTHRYSSGGSTNGGDAEQAIDCLDHPVDRNVADYPALAARAALTAPVFGPLISWGLLGCATWPVLPTRVPGPATDPGAPPVLVVGTSDDPVTPYAWSVALAHQLAGGVLLTWNGQSHVAAFYSACVRSAISTYLVDLTPPAAGAVCSD